MKHFRTSSLSLSFLCLLTGSALASETPTQHDVAVTPEGHLVTDANVNGQLVKLVIDTAATGTVIDDDALSALSLNTTAKRVRGLRSGDEKTGQFVTEALEPFSINLSGHGVTLSTAVTHDTNGQLGPGYAGLLGRDALHALQATLDMSPLMLRLGVSKIGKVEENTATAASLPLLSTDIGINYVEGILNGHNVNIIIDTGAPQFVFDQQALERIGVSSSEHPTARSVDHEGNEIPIRESAIHTVELGSAAVSKQFLVMDLSAIINSLGDASAHPFIGVIGMNDLIALEAKINFGENTVRFKS